MIPLRKILNMTKMKMNRLLLLSTILLLGAASCDREESNLVQDFPVAIRDIERVEEDIVHPHDNPPSPPSYEQVTNDDNYNDNYDKSDSGNVDDNLQCGSENNKTVSEPKEKVGYDASFR